MRKSRRTYTAEFKLEALTLSGPEQPKPSTEIAHFRSNPSHAMM